jgi:predicted dehydrogenase
MSEGKLKTAILGLNEGGQLLLEAAKAGDDLQIRAVADKDTNLAEKIAAECDCAAFDDYRQLIIQNQLDCLLVAEAMHSCEEYVRMAMKKKFNVLKLAPAARDFEEAAEFVRLGEEEEIQFAIANPSRFARSFLGLRQFLEEGKIEPVFLTTAFCSVGDYSHVSWQTDPKLAGGGVLLHNCYQMIDQIVWNFGVPQQVYSLNTNQAQDKQQRLYLTEDTAIVTMKFSDTFIGNFIASRREGIGPREEYVKLYGKNKILTVSDTQLTLCDGIGRVSEELEYDDDQRVCMTGLLKDFAQSILSPDENKLCSSGRENLKDMAVIESAYLSARTGFPEEPGRILQMASPGDAEATSSQPAPK